MMIPRVNSWAISGTPIKNSLSDLIFLFKFLKIPYVSDMKIFKSMLKPGATPALCKILLHFMHRKTKHGLSEELQIPPQRSKVVWLEFTEVEHEYYNQLRSKTVQDVIGLSSQQQLGIIADPRLVNNLKTWMLRLRQTWYYLIYLLFSL